MVRTDLETLMKEEGRHSIEDWVENFFSNKPFGSETFSIQHLEDRDLVPEFIEYSAQQLQVKPAELRAAIGEQQEHFVFLYRAAWREELMMLVYVPRYRRFVSFSGYGR